MRIIRNVPFDYIRNIRIMAEVRAKLSGYRQTPRKTRAVVSLIKGKKLQDVFNILDFTIKRPANPIKKLISSAVANAKNLGLSADSLFVKDIRVDQASVIKRIRPASRGSAHPIKRRSSHITVVLSTDNPRPTTKKTAKNRAVVGSESSVVS